jgi:hypothetical protein
MRAGWGLELPHRGKLVLADLVAVRLLTGAQIERLHFTGTKGSARGSNRRRTMRLLMTNQLVTTLPRRVGGERAGSAGLVYALDAAGQRWAVSQGLLDVGGRVRRPWSTSWRFVSHCLEVTELYVRLQEQQAAGSITRLTFVAEPASWHQAAGRPLKPDAYARFVVGQWEQHYWIEVDRATESLPSLRRKLLAYIDVAVSGDDGPHGVLPRVLVTVPDERRLRAVRSLVASLPEPADQLISAQLFDATFLNTNNYEQQAL